MTCCAQYGAHVVYIACYVIHATRFTHYTLYTIHYITHSEYHIARRPSYIVYSILYTVHMLVYVGRCSCLSLFHVYVSCGAFLSFPGVPTRCIVYLCACVFITCAETYPFVSSAPFMLSLCACVLGRVVRSMPFLLAACACIVAECVRHRCALMHVMSCLLHTLLVTLPLLQPLLAAHLHLLRHPALLLFISLRALIRLPSWDTLVLIAVAPCGLQQAGTSYWLGLCSGRL